MTLEQIRALFQQPDLAWIAERLRRRQELGQALTGTLTCPDASPAQRSALDNLLGRRATRGGTLSLRLEDLAAAIHGDVSDIVRACFGEVENRRAERESRLSRWDQIFDDALAALTGDAHGQEWIESMRADGLVKRFTASDPDRGASLMATALQVWKALPCPEPITLAQFAVGLTGDTHALDRGRALSPIVLRGLKFKTKHDGIKSAELRRLAWGAVGVIVDRLSAPALTFNLRANAGYPLATILDAARGMNQPCYLTYFMLGEKRAFSRLPPGMERIFVVENPTVVEVACARLGGRCAPLICTEGQPTFAVKELLWMLGNAGARILARADFDWPGLGFVDLLLRIPGVSPWRMDTATYASFRGTVPLEGRPAPFGWCAELAAAMSEGGFAIYEEQVLELLLEDLDTGRE